MPNRPIAFFITPHGFGHATRAAAVMAALQEKDPAIHFHIFTQVSSHIFQDSLPGSFTYHDLCTDIGMVQKNPLQADLPATLTRLDTFYPLDPDRISNLFVQVKRLKCDLILCDIAPIGILVAQEAQIPSILIENFTWDWIYEGYLDLEPALKKHIHYLKTLFHSATYHIQTQPVCNPVSPDLTVNPVSRKIRTTRADILKKLALPPNATAILITMGGTPFQYHDPDALSADPNCFFLLPNSGETLKTEANLVHIPHKSPIFHPDLVSASDVVIAKVGYSILAEVYRSGVPFGYIPRPGFRESGTLTTFIEHNMPGLPITDSAFESGTWVHALPDLLSLSRASCSDPNGADQIADFLLRLTL